MNYQLMDVMKEYRPEHERMLWGLASRVMPLKRFTTILA
jgi:hypothetical protein